MALGGQATLKFEPSPSTVDYSFMGPENGRNQDILYFSMDGQDCQSKTDFSGDIWKI